MQYAKDFMATGVVTISPEASIRDAIDTLLARRITGLPVVDKENNLVGVISQFALLSVAYDPTTVNDMVCDHMTANPISVSEEASMTEVTNLVICHRIGRLPVVRGRQLIGIITRSDVLRAATQSNAYAHAGV